MKPHFIFPCDPLNDRRVDAVFADQHDALLAAGFNCSVVDLDDPRITFGKNKQAVLRELCVYRGWMLGEKEYERLLHTIQTYGGYPITDENSYLVTHHLPNWYQYLHDVTPETMILPNGTYNIADLPELVRGLLPQWGGIVVKDYVKSLKTGYGHIINENPDILPKIIEQMVQYRGRIEGGLCLRRFEQFIPDSEKRFFCVNGHAYTAALDSNIRVMAESTYLALAAEVATRIPSHFFSVDIALTENLTPRVVEIGDGQVSDLVGWTPEEFAAMWIGQ